MIRKLKEKLSFLELKVNSGKTKYEAVGYEKEDLMTWDINYEHTGIQKLRRDSNRRW